LQIQFPVTNHQSTSFLPFGTRKRAADL